MGTFSAREFSKTYQYCKWCGRAFGRNDEPVSSHMIACGRGTDFLAGQAKTNNPGFSGPLGKGGHAALNNSMNQSKSSGSSKHTSK
mmetsp:Transcript_20705/g.39353  ORF Transcript_20705/g.39353 Transcript_20705/m.39353 type:complete len:86 (-) Transcript_20705:273-530(-)